MAEALDAKQASVGGEADPFQIFEVAQATADIEVVRVVDDFLGAQRAPLLKWYCLIRECLCSTCSDGVIPSVMTRVRYRRGVCAR